ncbi:MAG TPA: hypothetical protein VJU82_14920 [Acidobacteriaceae bacterium]|nr:hypothetical protein [Acidobacteriaceae bacterium]
MQRSVDVADWPEWRTRAESGEDEGFAIERTEGWAAKESSGQDRLKVAPTLMPPHE